MSNNQINISINDSSVSINDINVLNSNQVVSLINSHIDKFVGIQNNTIGEKSGVDVSGLFSEHLNGKYEQMNNKFKTLVLNKLVRFIIDPKYDSYYKQHNDDYYLITFLEPTNDNTSFNDLVLQPAWYILKYKTNPNDIHLGINHYNHIYDEPVLYFLGSDKKNFGENVYPKNPSVLYF